MAGTGFWLRSGPFDPVEGCHPFQELFQRQTRELTASRLAQNAYNREALAAVTKQVDALGLRLLDPDGVEIPIGAFELQDCADTLSEDPRELQVEIRDGDAYAKFFGRSAA